MAMGIGFMRAVMGRWTVWRVSLGANRGQGLVEYGLLMSLMVLAVIVGLSAFGASVAALMGNIVAQMPH